MHMGIRERLGRCEMAEPSRRMSNHTGDVEAELVFIDPAAGRPIAHTYRPPSGARRSGSYVRCRVSVLNGRNIGLTSLDREAFLLVRHRSRVVDFGDEADIKSTYYPEVVALAKAHTGASSVLVFDHTVRTTDAARARPGVLEPAMAMHNDYTCESAPKRVRDFLPAPEASRLLQHRVVQVTVWRPIRGPLQTKPLAVCDATTLKSDDRILGELHYPDRVGEFYAIAYDPDQRWYYFPEMQADEALLFKCYDSDPSRLPCGGHGAFADPTTPANALPRDSIEVRAFAFFAPL